MNKSLPTSAVIIVTHNSELHIDKAIACVNQQTLPATYIILVDSGSRDPSYLHNYALYSNVDITYAEGDIGFCKGNNIGMAKVPKDCDYVFFLNPDAFLTPTYLEKATAFMESPENQKCGALTGTLLGYDINNDCTTGTYDSTGIFQKWYGHWYDRGQGQKYVPEKYSSQEEIPAICGAAFFCRKKSLDEILLRGNEVLDNTFYMYKEDIDLSIRLRQMGWKLVFIPELTAYHCRGWVHDRSKIPRELRLASARNELILHKRLKAPISMTYSLLKYAAVKLLDM
jgi:GT2 family glycosyltransferase